METVSPKSGLTILAETIGLKLEEATSDDLLDALRDSDLPPHMQALLNSLLAHQILMETAK